MVDCYLNAVGICSDGIENWQQFERLLRDPAGYTPEKMTRYSPAMLPPNERRRASQLVRLAFRSIEQLGDSLDDCSYSMVFASSGGDYDIFHKVCTALARDEKVISPTQFHNSVHNAAAGYWSIATGNRKASTTISAYDFSFAMGLLESLWQLEAGEEAVLFSCYDMTPPPPLNQLRLIKQDFSLALALSNKKTLSSLARLSVSIKDEKSACPEILPRSLGELEEMNAAARGLSLLASISFRAPSVYFELEGGSFLKVELEYSE